jgi:hypothetical protein
MNQWNNRSPSMTVTTFAEVRAAFEKRGGEAE